MEKNKNKTIKMAKNFHYMPVVAVQLIQKIED